ncbi:transcriptional regulatory protein, partial [Myxozyma melibiosi]
MFVVQTTHSKTGLKRPDRPCDSCRRRKSRCVFSENDSVCFLCRFHNYECVFSKDPVPRKRQRRNSGSNSTAAASAAAASSAATDSSAAAQSSAPTAPEANTDVKSSAADDKDKDKEKSDADDALVSADVNSPFPDYDFMPDTLLQNTLGLQCRRYISYIGTSAEHDPILMDYYGFDNRDRASLPAVGPDFLTKRHPNPSGRDDTIGGNLAEVRKIQDIIGNFGRQLVGLYFRIVHASLPILHKEEFLEKYYRNPSELSPSLLAGLYVFAINWWTYDADLVPFPRPPQSALEALAQINLYREIDRPTLSTVQAGILLLQHQTFRNQVTRPSHSWAMLGELVSVAQEVGLHMDPTRWEIPEWERGLRKRLAWGLYIQDKWMALTYGRPSKIHKINWTVSPLVDENFPDDDGDENNGMVNRETGKVMFMQLVNLTIILSEILDQFHSARNEDRMKGILAKARPLQIRLKDWLENLPDCLRMENITLGELSASGNLHLAYHATQIALFRPILRALKRIDRTASPALSEIYMLVYRSAFAEFVSAVEFVNSLKQEHIQTFWYAASKNNFAIIATFGVMLMLLATNEADKIACQEKLAEYQWTLKVNVRGAEFLQHAILWVEE